MPRADGQGQGGGQRPAGTGFNQLSQCCSVRREEEVSGSHLVAWKPGPFLELALWLSTQERLPLPVAFHGQGPTQAHEGLRLWPPVSSALAQRCLAGTSREWESSSDFPWTQRGFQRTLSISVTYPWCPSRTIYAPVL